MHTDVSRRGDYLAKFTRFSHLLLHCVSSSIHTSGQLVKPRKPPVEHCYLENTNMRRKILCNITTKEMFLWFSSPSLLLNGYRILREKFVFL